jgi:hypothetical protein
MARGACWLVRRRDVTRNWRSQAWTGGEWPVGQAVERCGGGFCVACAQVGFGEQQAAADRQFVVGLSGHGDREGVGRDGQQRCRGGVVAGAEPGQSLAEAGLEQEAGIGRLADHPVEGLGGGGEVGSSQLNFPQKMQGLVFQAADAFEAFLQQLDGGIELAQLGPRPRLQKHRIRHERRRGVLGTEGGKVGGGFFGETRLKRSHCGVEGDAFVAVGAAGGCGWGGGWGGGAGGVGWRVGWRGGGVLVAAGEVAGGGVAAGELVAGGVGVGCWAWVGGLPASRGEVALEVVPVWEASQAAIRFGGAFGDDPAAAGAAFRAEVEDPVGGLDHVEVVFDDDQGVAGVAEFEEDFEQFGDVVEVQAGGRFVEEVERAAGVFAAEFGGELEALGFAAGEGGAGLAEAEVAEADFGERGADVVDAGHGAEEGHGFVDGEVEDVGDVQALVGDLEGFAVVAPAAALFAGHVDRREEVHLDAEDAVAFAGLAAAALDVEAEAARAVAADAGGGQLREEIADLVEEAGEGGGVAARRAADGGLVDDHHLVEASMPRISRWRPGRSLEPNQWRNRARRRMSSTRVLLPEPLTPVTQVSVPSGMRASMLRRLFSAAPRISSQPRSLGGATRRRGTGTDSSPEVARR